MGFQKAWVIQNAAFLLRFAWKGASLLISNDPFSSLCHFSSLISLIEHFDLLFE